MAETAELSRRLYRVGPEGFYAAHDPGGTLRVLYSDPFEVPLSQWTFGRETEDPPRAVMVPVAPSKIVGIGRSYRAHAEELGNPVPDEPLLFLKSPGSLGGTRSTVLLPPESERVEFEGEIAVVLRAPLVRARPAQARAAVLGVTAACDVTARDLQRRDATFARGKSFDTFCPVGPAIALEPDLEGLSVTTRIDGVERQQGTTGRMLWSIVELLVYVSRMMRLEAGDLLLTGTPEGVGPLEHGAQVEIEVTGAGTLEFSVERRIDP